MNPSLEPPVIAAEALKQQIGVATMEKDGTIVMYLRMLQGAAVGDAQQRYVPRTRYYEVVRSHLPELAPGKWIPVYNDWD